MALTEKDTYQVEVTESDHVQVRKRTTIYRDGVSISSTLHRHVISPGDDYSGEVDKVQQTCAVIHTPAVVAEYQAAQNALLVSAV